MSQSNAEKMAECTVVKGRLPTPVIGQPTDDRMVVAHSDLVAGGALHGLLEAPQLALERQVLVLPRGLQTPRPEDLEDEGFDGRILLEQGTLPGGFVVQPQRDQLAQQFLGLPQIAIRVSREAEHAPADQDGQGQDSQPHEVQHVQRMVLQIVGKTAEHNIAILIGDHVQPYMQPDRLSKALSGREQHAFAI